MHACVLRVVWYISYMVHILYMERLTLWLDDGVRWWWGATEKDVERTCNALKAEHVVAVGGDVHLVQHLVGRPFERGGRSVVMLLAEHFPLRRLWQAC